MKIPADILSKKILILGFGIEGMSTLSYLHTNFPTIPLAVVDQTPFETLPKDTQKILTDTHSTYHGGNNYLDAVLQYEVVFKSPGISPYVPPLIAAVKNGVKIVSQTQIFLLNYHHVTIGVTGTKGKSTTSSLIHYVLQQGGFDVYLIGNIGIPPFSYNKETGEKTLFVYELSSHQLQDVTVSPHIAVVLDIVPEHLDYYPSFQEYQQAKTLIVRYQTNDDFVVYNHDLLQPRSVAQLSNGIKLPFSLRPHQNARCWFKNGFLWYGSAETQEKIIAADRIPLPGLFNLNNVMPAIIIAKQYGVPTAVIRDAIVSFKPLPTRLENIGVYRDITFYDDSLATIPEATIAALDALGDRVSTLIVGGFERNQDFTVLAQKISKSTIKTVIAFPTTGARIIASIKPLRKTKNQCTFFPAFSMEEAVALAYTHTPRGTICLLSTASPSFSLFKDYKEKSRLFRHFVKKIGKN